MWAETTSDDANIRARQPGDEIGDDTAPCRTVLVLAGLPPWFIGGRVQDGVPSAEPVRPTFLVAPFTAIRNVRVRRRTSGNSYSRSSVVHRAKIVVDVGVGFLRRSRSRTCSLAQRQEIGVDTVPCRTILVLVCLLPRWCRR